MPFFYSCEHTVPSAQIKGPSGKTRAAKVSLSTHRFVKARSPIALKALKARVTPAELCGEWQAVDAKGKTHNVNLSVEDISALGPIDSTFVALPTPTNEPLDPKVLVMLSQTLQNGSSADIWYDAQSFDDPADRDYSAEKTINCTQQAMHDAAWHLEMLASVALHQAMPREANSLTGNEVGSIIELYAALQTAEVQMSQAAKLYEYDDEFQNALSAVIDAGTRAGPVVKRLNSGDQIEANIQTSNLLVLTPVNKTGVSHKINAHDYDHIKFEGVEGAVDISLSASGRLTPVPMWAGRLSSDESFVQFNELCGALLAAHGARLRVETDSFLDLYADQFDAVEIHTMGLHGRTEYAPGNLIDLEDLPPGTPLAAYSVMLHLRRGGVDTLCDIRAPEEAHARAKTWTVVNRLATSVGNMLMKIDPSLSREFVLGKPSSPDSGLTL